MGVNRRHPAGFKAKVALEAIKQDKTIAQLSSQFGVHANMISKMKKIGGKLPYFLPIFYDCFDFYL